MNFESADYSEEVLRIAELIKPYLAFKRPELQGAVLAELLSIWLGGHVVFGDEEETRQLREELLKRHIGLVRELLAVNARSGGRQ